MVRTLKAFLPSSQFNCLGSASLSLMVPPEAEDDSKRVRAVFPLFLLEASEGFVGLFYSRNLLK